MKTSICVNSGEMRSYNEVRILVLADVEPMPSICAVLYII